MDFFFANLELHVITLIAKNLRPYLHIYYYTFSNKDHTTFTVTTQTNENKLICIHIIHCNLKNIICVKSYIIITLIQT